MNKFRILFGVIFVLLFSISAYYFGEKIGLNSKRQVCTQEAKICPDGSTVSRTGPNCEFAPCPQITKPAEKELDTSCFSDEDCKLMDQKLSSDCCARDCQPIDYSESKWIAVNTRWRDEGCKIFWSTPMNECLPCQPKQINENIGVVCQNRTCQKIFSSSGQD